MEEIEGRDSELEESLLAFDSRRKRPVRKEWRELLHGLSFIQDNMKLEDAIDQVRGVLRSILTALWWLRDFACTVHVY